MSAKMVTFKKVFNKYSALGKARNEDAGHKESQVREKLMEIIDAVGIETKLLRVGEKFNSPLEIPEASVDFLVEVIDWHTSSEAKALRKAKFFEVPIEKKAWLINGFIDYLKNRGYDAKVIEHQQRLMEYRLKYSLQRKLNKLRTSLNDIHAHICTLNRQQVSYLIDEDQILFIDFADKKVTELANYLDDVAAYSEEVRSEEIYEKAEENCNKWNAVEVREVELRQGEVYQRISHDERYKKLKQECDSLIAEDDFIKKKKGRYDQIVKEMCEIADGYEKAIFGDIMADEPENKFSLKAPHVVLAEAICHKKEADELYKMMLSQPPMSEEQKEEIKQFFAEHGINIDAEMAMIEEVDDNDE